MASGPDPGRPEIPHIHIKTPAVDNALRPALSQQIALVLAVSRASITPDQSLSLCEAVTIATQATSSANWARQLR